jgi:hypothetical protein
MKSKKKRDMIEKYRKTKHTYELNFCIRFSNRNLIDRKKLMDLVANGENIKTDIWELICKDINWNKKAPK